jgi:hypothetical protein
MYLAADKHAIATVRTGMHRSDRRSGFVLYQSYAVVVRDLMSALRWPCLCHGPARSSCCKHYGLWSNFQVLARERITLKMLMHYTDRIVALVLLGQLLFYWINVFFFAD